MTWPVAPEPPCEQVLAEMGGRRWCLLSLVSLAHWHCTHLQTTLQAAAHRCGGEQRVVPGCWGPRHRPSIVIVVAVSTCDPTCEQLLTARGAGATSSWRCFGGGHCCCPVVVTWLLASTIHPASSRSQQWGWVLAGCLSLMGCRGG